MNVTQYLGCKGLAAYYMLKEFEPEVDLWSAHNKLLYFVGPLTGLFPGTDRFVVASKSPQSNTFSDGYAGGWFGTELRKAGYIGLIIEGKASDLVYIKIDGDKVSIENAASASPSDSCLKYPFS